MDVNDEECMKKEQEIQGLITSFMNSYDEYMKIELVHPSNKEIQELYMLSSNINSLIEQINHKIENVIEMYENHPRKKFYQSNVKSLQRKKDTIDRLGQKFKEKLDYIVISFLIMYIIMKKRMMRIIKLHKLQKITTTNLNNLKIYQKKTMNKVKRNYLY